MLGQGHARRGGRVSTFLFSIFKFKMVERNFINKCHFSAATDAVHDSRVSLGLAVSGGAGQRSGGDGVTLK